MQYGWILKAQSILIVYLKMALTFAPYWTFVLKDKKVFAIIHIHKASVKLQYMQI